MPNFCSQSNNVRNKINSTCTLYIRDGCVVDCTTQLSQTVTPHNNVFTEITHQNQVFPSSDDQQDFLVAYLCVLGESAVQDKDPNPRYSVRNTRLNPCFKFNLVTILNYVFYCQTFYYPPPYIYILLT